MAHLSLILWSSLFTAAYSLWVGWGTHYHLTMILFGKMLSITNFCAIYSLHSQKPCYDKLLQMSPEKAREIAREISVMYVCSVLLFFGVGETLCAALLAAIFVKVSRNYRPFTGLQMFSQLPEATALYALTSLVTPWNASVAATAQQFFVLRLMLIGGVGKTLSRTSL